MAAIVKMCSSMWGSPLAGVQSLSGCFSESHKAELHELCFASSKFEKCN